MDFSLGSDESFVNGLEGNAQGNTLDLPSSHGDAWPGRPRRLFRVNGRNRSISQSIRRGGWRVWRLVCRRGIVRERG